MDEPRPAQVPDAKRPYVKPALVRDGEWALFTGSVPSALT